MSITARFFVFCAAVLSSTVIAASADLDTRGSFIDVNAGLLSVNLEKAELADVLRTVGEQTGARVSIKGDLGAVQPQVFWRLPLTDGINRLVQNSNADLVMIYNQGTAGYSLLTEIRAYEGNRNNRGHIHTTSRIIMPTPPPVIAPTGDEAAPRDQLQGSW